MIKTSFFLQLNGSLRHLIGWGVAVACLVLSFEGAWADDARVAAISAASGTTSQQMARPQVTRPGPASGAVLEAGVARPHQVSQDFGVMRQSIFAPGVSVLLTIPVGVVGLAPLIGNAVVLSGDWKRRTRLGWGIAGIVVGLGGIVFTGAMWGLDRPSSDTGNFEPVRDVVNPVMIAIHVATVALGVANVVKAAKRRRRAGLIPPAPSAPQRRLAGATIHMSVK